MHPGFAKPFMGLLIGCVIIVLSSANQKVVVSLLTVLSLIVAGGSIASKRVAFRQVKLWAAKKNIHEVVLLQRGGFVTWGWSIWTFAELAKYRGVDSDGRLIEILGRHRSPAFGWLTFTICEVLENSSRTAEE